MKDWRKILPLQMCQPFRDMLEKVPEDLAMQTREIRIRMGRPVLLVGGQEERFVGIGGIGPLQDAYVPDYKDCKLLLETFCGHSLYAFEEEIRQGFLTLRGGFRVGLTGRGVVEDASLKRLTQIGSFTIRIAREIQGIARPILPNLMVGKRLMNTLIISPPGLGKTTLLRDMVRLVSDEGLQVGLADERGEVAALYKGEPQLDVGLRTDVLDGCPKAMAMQMLLRSMAPQIIATDELSIPKELPTVRSCVDSGVSVIATAHLTKWEGLGELFGRVVVLGGDIPGRSVEVYDGAMGRRLISWKG